MRVFNFIFILFLLIFSHSTSAYSQQSKKRFALLVGNKNYDIKSLNLEHPHNNVDRLSKSLMQANFVVKVVKDANLDQLKNELKTYTDNLKQAGQDAIGFFYYSGQGKIEQKSKSPFIIPKDMSKGTAETLWNNSYSVNELTRTLKRMAVNAAHIAVFDTCYQENILGDASDISGLATIPRMLISYTSMNCNLNNKNSDKIDRHLSIFLDEMKKADNDVIKLFEVVQQQINEHSGHQSYTRSNAFPKVYLVDNNKNKKQKTYSVIRSAPKSLQQDRKPLQAVSPEKTEQIDNMTFKQNDTRTTASIIEKVQQSVTSEKQEENSEIEQKTKTEEKYKQEPETLKIVRDEKEEKKAEVIEKGKVKTPFPHGHIFDDCNKEAWCPSMIIVKGGKFMMGSPEKEKGRQSDEGPQRDVTIKSFAVGRYEVTFAEWDACLREGGCKHKPDDAGWGRGKQPVINISWEDTQSYISWLSKKTGIQYRLLTEAEWEYIARAGSTTPYSFGHKIADLCKYANGADQSSGYRWRNRTCDDGVGQKTAPVGSYKPNAFGIYDVHGNVWEWVEDCWWKSYKVASLDGAAWVSKMPSVCNRRIVRGSSWAENPNSLRSANRSANTIIHRSNNYGFRVARDN